MNILEEIAKKTKERIEEEKKQVPLSVWKEKIRERQEEGKGPAESFYDALKKEGMSYICEVKKASPSKGLIAPDFPYLQIAKEYEQAGARAISCLTEPFYFQGSDQYLQEIADSVNIPVLRKDFTIDEKQREKGSFKGSQWRQGFDIMTKIKICGLRTLEEKVIRMAQLHGTEKEDYVRALSKSTGKPIIKAFSIRRKEDIREALISSANYILLDQGNGGTGKTFDWSLIPDISRPFFLAGGLGLYNLDAAIDRIHPWAVDLSSSLETERKKDRQKMIEAVQLVRNKSV